MSWFHLSKYDKGFWGFSRWEAQLGTWIDKRNTEAAPWGPLHLVKSGVPCTGCMPALKRQAQPEVVRGRRSVGLTVIPMGTWMGLCSEEQHSSVERLGRGAGATPGPLGNWGHFLLSQEKAQGRGH